jgi:hypothetical protein
MGIGQGAQQKPLIVVSILAHLFMAHFEDFSEMI